MATIVQKYGGTSVDGPERIMGIASRVAELRRRGDDVVVVVSAPGNTTDALLEQARALADRPSQRELDMLMTAGERISMSLLSIALNSIGCPAVSFTGSQVGIITDTAHTEARILEVRPLRVIKELAAGNVVVVGGFQGVSTAKDVTTLGRGGSDTTAVALAAALGAERCEILTDVDGVYSADPRVVGGAVRIDELTYEDMCELARFGATVLKEEAVRFAERHSIVLSVRESTTDSGGTIVLERPSGPCRAVVGLSCLRNALLVSGRGQTLPGTAAAPAGGRSPVIAVAVLKDRALVALDTEACGGSVGDWTEDAASVEECSLVCIVGPDAGCARVASRVTEVLAELGAGLLALFSEGRSTVVAVRRDSSGEVLRRLHEEFVEQRS